MLSHFCFGLDVVGEFESSQCLSGHEKEPQCPRAARTLRLPHPSTSCRAATWRVAVAINEITPTKFIYHCEEECRGSQLCVWDVPPEFTDAPSQCCHGKHQFPVCSLGGPVGSSGGIHPPLCSDLLPPAFLHALREPGSDSGFPGQAHVLCSKPLWSLKTSVCLTVTPALTRQRPSLLTTSPPSAAGGSRSCSVELVVSDPRGPAWVTLAQGCGQGHGAPVSSQASREVGVPSVTAHRFCRLNLRVLWFPSESGHFQSCFKLVG